LTEVEETLRPGVGGVGFDCSSPAREAAASMVDSRLATRDAKAGASGRGGGEGKLSTSKSLAAPFVGVSAFDSSESEVRERVFREPGEVPFVVIEEGVGGAGEAGEGGTGTVLVEAEVGLRSTPRCL